MNAQQRRKLRRKQEDERRRLGIKHSYNDNYIQDMLFNVVRKLLLLPETYVAPSFTIFLNGKKYTASRDYIQVTSSQVVFKHTL